MLHISVPQSSFQSLTYRLQSTFCCNHHSVKRIPRFPVSFYFSQSGKTSQNSNFSPIVSSFRNIILNLHFFRMSHLQTRSFSPLFKNVLRFLNFSESGLCYQFQLSNFYNTNIDKIS